MTLKEAVKFIYDELILERLGVRMRWMSFSGGEFEVQAENPYKFWIGPRERKKADEDMSEKGLRAYER